MPLSRRIGRRNALPVNILRIRGLEEAMPQQLVGAHYRDHVTPGDKALGLSFDELMALGTGEHDLEVKPVEQAGA